MRNLYRNRREDRLSYIISLRNFLEFGFGVSFVVRVLIWMPLHGELSVRFLQVLVVGITINLKNLVVINAHSSVVFLRFVSTGLRLCNLVHSALCPGVAKTLNGNWNIYLVYVCCGKIIQHGLKILKNSLPD